MNTKLIFQTVIGATGYIAWAVMAYLDPTLRADFLKFNIAMAVGTIGLVLRDMRASADSTPPVGKQSGHALTSMLVILAAGAALLLSACATSGTQQTAQSTQVSYTQACAAYGGVFATALELRRAGKLSRSEIDQVTLIDSQVTPICTGALPADPSAAMQQITAAVTTLAILEAAK